MLAATPASAHVLLEGKQAAVGADYKAVFVVPHGCAGSPTVKLRVQIPEGVIATEAKPVDRLDRRHRQGQICQRI